jgi:hypothetical protein
MRSQGATLFAIRDTMRGMGYQVSHETVRKLLVQRT